MIVSIRQAGRLGDGKDDQSQEFPTKTQHVWTAAWIGSESRSYQPLDQIPQEYKVLE